VLEARVRAPTTERRDVLRARIILLAAEGCSTRSIARAVDAMPRTNDVVRGLKVERYNMRRVYSKAPL
jgi:hypothetical protein